MFSSHSRIRPQPLATILPVAAQALQRSKTPLGDRFWALKARLGPPKAITAMAHLLAKFIYRALTRGQAYLENGLKALAEQTNQTKVQALQRRASHLGYLLTPIAETA